MSVTLDWFLRYINPQPKKIRHPFYDKSVKKYEAIRFHANGEKPQNDKDGDIIRTRRPSESKEIFKYRKDIFVSITMPTFTKVYNSLMKIRKAHDWSIREGERLSSISEAESLFNYIMINFPKYTSITNWYFQIALKQQLIDTNAKVLVMPVNLQIPDNEYNQPFPFIINSENVWDYKYDNYYVLLSPEKILYKEQNQLYEGNRFYIVTKDSIQIFDQASRDEKYIETINYPHGLEYIPVFDMKGIVMDETFYQCLYDSKIMAMIPRLDEAAREYSDMQAEVVQHIHSMLAVYQPTDCTKCKGTGQVKKKDNVNVNLPCDKCGGRGIFPFNPYHHYVLGKQPADGQPLPWPPLKYIEKQVEIVKIQNERIDGHQFAALSAINMEFLASTPLNQSGLAKEVDKEELNNFVHGVAEDGVELLDNVIECISDYRYTKVAGYLAKKKDLLPVVNVPEKFDLLGDKFLLEGLNEMKQAKVDPSIIVAAEEEYAAKRFNTDPAVKNLVSLKLRLDPFGGVTDEEVTSRLNSQLITELDAVIHANIAAFIERALEENKEFVKMKKSEQLIILAEYAEEKMKEIADQRTAAIEQAAAAVGGLQEEEIEAAS